MASSWQLVPAALPSRFGGNSWCKCDEDCAAPLLAGVLTGAVYTDPSLWRMGLVGEGVSDRTVVAVKSHVTKGVSFFESREQFMLLQYDQVRPGRLS